MTQDLIHVDELQCNSLELDMLQF